MPTIYLDKVKNRWRVQSKRRHYKHISMNFDTYEEAKISHDELAEIEREQDIKHLQLSRERKVGLLKDCERIED